eukprot:3034442-Pleurochrysis_carterae.AAC.1
MRASRESVQLPRRSSAASELRSFRRSVGGGVGTEVIMRRFGHNEGLNKFNMMFEQVQYDGFHLFVCCSHRVAVRLQSHGRPCSVFAAMLQPERAGSEATAGAPRNA